MPIYNTQNEQQNELIANNVISLENDITFYIHEDGRDTDSGTLPTKAWKTLSYAYQYIKNHVITNGYKVHLSIEKGTYPAEELIQTVILSSPVHLNDDYVIVPKQQQLDLEGLEKRCADQINLLRSTVVELHNTIIKSKQTFENFYVRQEDLQQNISVRIAPLSHDIETITKQIAEAFEKAANLEKGQGVISEDLDETDDRVTKNLQGLNLDTASLAALADNAKRERRTIVETVQAMNKTLKILTDSTQQLQDKDKKLAKKRKKLETEVDGIGNSVSALSQKLGNLDALVEVINETFIKDISGVNSSLFDHKRNEANPHKVTTSDLKFDGTTLENTLIDLYDRTRVRYRFEEDSLTLTDLTGNNLNKSLQVWAASCDFSGEEIWIDLQGKLHEKVLLVDIPTAKKVKIMNGMIYGMAAHSVNTSYEFENITFITKENKDDARIDYAIALSGGSKVTLFDCSVRSGESGCIMVTTGAQLRLHGSLHLPDKEITTVVYSEFNAIVIARNVRIIPNASSAVYGHLAWAESNSSQDWRNIHFEGEVNIINVKREYIGGIVVTNMKDGIQ